MSTRRSSDFAGVEFAFDMAETTLQEVRGSGAVANGQRVEGVGDDRWPTKKKLTDRRTL
jgi:hypothetical protein